MGAGLLVVDALVSREDGLYLTPAGYAVFAGIYCGLGAGAGAGIDALIGGNRNLYRRGGSARLRVAPAFGAESERRVIGTVVVAGGGCVDASRDPLDSRRRVLRAQPSLSRVLTRFAHC